MNLLLTCLLAGVSGLMAQAAAPVPLPPATYTDVSYGPHERHTLDLWQAAASAPTPLVIFIHGGGWHGGSKGDVVPKVLTYLLAHGVSVASINYRYSSMATLPGPVHDAARAVQFLRSKAAEWKLDPARFGAYGVSAGGCTTLWLAYHDDLADPASADPIARQSSRLQAAVGISPQSSLEPEVIVGWVGEQVLNHPMIARAVGAKKLDELKNPRPEWVTLLHEFSPITHVSRGDPPVLVGFPRVDPLPAASAGGAIHPALFGMKLKERADAVGARCVVRIQDQQAGAPTPEPEEFLAEQLAAK